MIKLSFSNDIPERTIYFSMELPKVPGELSGTHNKVWRYYRREVLEKIHSAVVEYCFTDITLSDTSVEITIEDPHEAVPEHIWTGIITYLGNVTKSIKLTGDFLND